MNPFILSNYAGPEYFCDRENETKTLLQNILNQSNTTFFAQRRLGKTALVNHAFYHLKKKNIVCLYLDIYATQNLKDLSNAIANSIYNSFPQKNTIAKNFREAIKLLRPVLTIDELSGTPELSLDITQPRQFEKTIPQLLQFLDKQNKQVVIAIDEFQQILLYPEKNVEALLRSVIQQLKNVHFIFCGSNQKMMHHIFNNNKRPFFASAKTINLKKIDATIYTTFIKSQFGKNKTHIRIPSVELILKLTAGHTYYTQRLCHELFVKGSKNITTEIILQELNHILLENEGSYFQYRNLVTLSQWKLLVAIAKEEKVTQPYSQDFVYKYKLGSPANVRRGILSLIEKELIFQHLLAEDGYYEIEDKFFMRWLQRRT